MLFKKFMQPSCDRVFGLQQGRLMHGISPINAKAQVDRSMV
jgi:hypothetical protein